jgi:multidrug resistance efflux pump
MNDSAPVPTPIPVPAGQRWFDVRVRFLPVLIFAGALGCAAMLWRGDVGAPALIGQAEPVVSDVSCHKTGVLTELNVTRFQRVKTGDRIALVMIVDPQVMTNSLAVIRAEIDMLRATLMPITQRQRTAMEYDKYRLDWLEQRTQLATARAELQYAEGEFRRMESLFKEKPPIVSERQYDQAKEQRDRRQEQVNELSKVVSECETQFQELQLTNTMDLSRVTGDPLSATIAVQEAKLRLTEAEQIPVIVKAPMDGIVTIIYHRVGEAVTPGLPIVALATLEPVRIVGYLRPPIVSQPKPGMRVSIRTRGLRRQYASATIIEVGTQLETIPATLLGPVNFASIVQGLPLNISLPPNIKVSAGEVVDISLTQGAAQ